PVTRKKLSGGTSVNAASSEFEPDHRVVAAPFFTQRVIVFGEMFCVSGARVVETLPAGSTCTDEVSPSPCFRPATAFMSRFGSSCPSPALGPTVGLLMGTAAPGAVRASWRRHPATH